MCQHFDNGMPACSPNLEVDIDHLERIQGLVTGIRQLPYEGRLQRLDLHSLLWRRLRIDLTTEFKVFTGLLDVGLLYLASILRTLIGHPLKVLQGTSHRRREGSVFQ